MGNRIAMRGDTIVMYLTPAALFKEPAIEVPHLEVEDTTVESPKWL